MIDDLMPVELWNVDIASFYPTERYIQKLIVGIEPVQSGSGDPAPDNVRPITGWSAAGIAHAGRQLFVKADTDSGYLDSSGVENSSTVWYITDYMEVNGDVFYNGMTQVGTAPYSCWYDASKTFISSFKQAVGENVITPPAGAKYVRFSVYGYPYSGGDLDAFKVYSDYTIHIISLGQAVYGGRLDVVRGVLTVDREMVDGGDLTWTKEVTNYRTFTTLRNDALFSASLETVISSNYKSTTYSVSSPSEDNYVWIRTSGVGREIAVKDTSKSGLTAAQFQTAMVGVQFVYELYTPFEITLTPTQIATLHPGINNVWCDTGPIIELIS